MKYKWIFATALAIFTGSACFAQGLSSSSKFREEHKYTYELMQTVQQMGAVSRSSRAGLTSSQAKQALTVINPLKKQSTLTQRQAQQALKKLQPIIAASQKNELSRTAPRTGQYRPDSKQIDKQDPQAKYRPDSKQSDKKDDKEQYRPNHSDSPRQHRPDSKQPNDEKSSETYQPDSKQSDKKDDKEQYRPNPSDSPRQHRPDSKQPNDEKSSETYQPDSKQSDKKDDLKDYKPGSSQPDSKPSERTYRPNANRLPAPGEGALWTSRPLPQNFNPFNDTAAKKDPALQSLNERMNQAIREIDRAARGGSAAPLIKTPTRTAPKRR